MLTLQHLYIIEKIISEGSVTKASEKLNLTQSALSHQIRDLETAAGLKLFNRIGKKLVLSEAGKKIVAGSEKILPVIREIEADLKEMRSGKLQTIRISTECYTCYHWLPKLLSEFNQEFPNITVQIVAEATRKPMTFLEAGQLDLAVVSREALSPKFTYEPLFGDELVLLTAQNHPLALHDELLEISDLQNETLIVFQADANEGFLTKDFVSSLTPKKVIQIPITEAIVEMVKYGMGVTIMTDWAARQYEKTQGLRRLNFNHGSGNRSWYACTRTNPDESLTALIMKIKQALQSEQPV